MFKRIRYLSLIVIVSLLVPLSAFSQEETTIYDNGLKLYTEGDFAGAVDEWSKLATSGYSSSVLFYNLGNACFKSGDIPGAILYYEKAALLRPFDEDIRYNLEIARTYVVDQLEVIPELFFIRWFRMVSLSFSVNKWAIISILSFTTGLMFLLVYLLTIKYSVKKLAFLFSLLLVFFSALTFSLAMENRSLTSKSRHAIIFTPVVNGKSSPSESGNDLFVIHEGTKVKINDEISGWYEIRLSDGSVGWIPAGDARKI